MIKAAKHSKWIAGLATCICALLPLARHFTCGEVCTADFLCEERLVVALSSPDKHFVAALVARDCGATTRPVYVVKLRRIGYGLLPCQTRDIMAGNDIYRIEWLSDRKLLVRGSIFDKFSPTDTGAFGIQVQYNTH